MSTDQYVHIPVCLHVFLAVDTGLECLLTIWAHEGSDLAVCRHMTLQTSIGCKCAVTDQAFVGFQTSVGPNMSLKNTTGYKRSSALKALKRLLPYEIKYQISSKMILPSFFAISKSQLQVHDIW